jgi:lipoyl(octanoyl) transferase
MLLFVALQQIHHRDSDFVALDLDFTLRHRLVIGQDGDRVVLVGIQFDHRPAAHAQKLMHWDHRAAQNDRNLDLHIIQVGSHAARPYIADWRQGCPHHGFGKLNLDAPIGQRLEWKISDRLVPYPEALAQMEARADAIAAGAAGEQVWLLEHPPIYTAGTSARDEDLIDARFPVYRTGRGGQFTYHGPGQRIGYVMLDLKHRKPDVRAYVRDLEQWLIDALALLGVNGERREGRVGIWVARPSSKNMGREDKIAALGVRIRHWVTFHGVALNVEPDLSHFTGIVPCGVREHGVTSLADLGIPVAMADVDVAMKQSFEKIFG